MTRGVQSAAQRLFVAFGIILWPDCSSKVVEIILPFEIEHFL